MNERQKRAIDYFIELGNKTQAMIKAGYSEKTARTNRWNKIAEMPECREYLSERIKQLDDERIASASEVMKYLTSVLRGEQTEEVIVVEGVGDGISSARNIQKEIAAKDRIKAAELLGKRYGIYTDKMKVESKPVIIRDDVCE